MKKLCILSAAVAVVLSVAVAQEKPAVLTIHMDKAVSKVSPTLYGLMTEEINYSYDGGLHAELVRNRTFRARRRDVAYWLLAEYGNAQAAMEADQQTGPSQDLNFSLKLTVSHADPQNQAGVLNTGYWGIPLRPNTTYTGSFEAKAGSEELGPVSIRLLTDADDAVLASTTVSGLTDQWKQYQFTLKTGAIQESSTNHLVLTVGHPGTLWLSLVSLFPPTYHDRPNGNRIDIMEKLAAMHPAFLRFPGGNYLEGEHIPDRFNSRRMAWACSSFSSGAKT